MSRKETRRRVLVGTGTLAAATISVVSLGSQNATATVAGEFTIPDGTAVLADETLNDVRLDATATWSYESNAPMNAVEVELHVGTSPDTLDLIARTTKDGLSKASLSGEEELNGSLMSASDFDIADFRPENGELSVTVVAELRLYVLRDDKVVADARQPTTFTVTVREEELAVTTTLGGSGEVVFDSD